MQDAAILKIIQSFTESDFFARLVEDLAPSLLNEANLKTIQKALSKTANLTPLRIDKYVQLKKHAHVFSQKELDQMLALSNAEEKKVTLSELIFKHSLEATLLGCYSSLPLAKDEAFQNNFFQQLTTEIKRHFNYLNYPLVFSLLEQIRLEGILERFTPALKAELDNITKGKPATLTDVMKALELDQELNRSIEMDKLIWPNLIQNIAADSNLLHTINATKAKTVKSIFINCAEEKRNMPQEEVTEVAQALTKKIKQNFYYIQYPQVFDLLDAIQLEMMLKCLTPEMKAEVEQITQATPATLEILMKIIEIDSELIQSSRVINSLIQKIKTDIKILAIISGVDEKAVEDILYIHFIDAQQNTPQKTISEIYQELSLQLAKAAVGFDYTNLEENNYRTTSPGL